MKVAGIVTLYNPTDKDISNILTYINDIDKLYIIDNTEGHNNMDRLPNNSKIEYIFNNKNVGVGEALNIGAKKAIDEGYKWLLTMDQDTTVKVGVMDRLKEEASKCNYSEIGIVTPWHKTKLRDKRPETEIDYPNDVMTSGNLVNLGIYQKVGGYRSDFFIDGIDIEYCLKLNSKGYKIMRINNIEIDHNLGDLFYKTFRGKLYLCTNHASIRRYYIMRNYHYICDEYKNYNPNYCYSLIAQKHNMKGVIYFEKHKIRKIFAYLMGLKDYKKGITGKCPYKL